VDKERTSVGIGGGRQFSMKLLLLCRLPAGGKVGESGKEGVSVSGFE
jgi:hypothetical protein